jgi:hypothetical protein
MPNTDAEGTRVERRSMFQSTIMPADGISAAKCKKAETSVCRRFMGSSQTSNALDRARRLRFVRGHCRSKCPIPEIANTPIE